MVHALSSTLKRGRELAHKRRQATSTAHVLVALFQADEDVRDVCLGLGVSEGALLGMLGHTYEERPNAIDLAFERGLKLAAALAVPDVRAMHVLLALAREPRCAANAVFQGLGVAPEYVSRVCLSRLEEPARAPAAEARAVRLTEISDRGPTSARLSQWRDSLARLEFPPEAEVVAAEGGGAEALDGSSPRLLHRHKRLQENRRRALLAEETETKLLRRPSAPDAPLALEPEPAIDVPEPPRPRGRALEADAWAIDPERFPLLASIGQNLTVLAASDRLDPVVGRDEDVQRVLDVLARRRANNPLLVGAPGVGKTAIAHGLAHAFVRTARDTAAQPRVLIELSVSSLLSGTGVRGALSERVQQLRREVSEAAGRVLLFIDEIHGLLGSGEADSLANELKTSLARGELPLLGATTDAEFRRVFERDAALARRFTRIDIAEPRPEQAVEILRLIAPQYARHHNVEYDSAALTAAVEMSVRYLPQRQLPDKAIALMDQAGARAQRAGASIVDVRAVASVVAELARVPVERLMMNDSQALLALEPSLAERVVGQTAALSCVANALRKSAAGFRGARPLGTFLFTGPTGVGKTELAKSISDVLFPGIPWTRIDMSELGQAHGVARLLGAPPGYLGHDDGGQLTEAVRNRPYQLILLDEIEKAHLEVLMSLLPLLDEGRLTDGRGRTVDFTNTVIVMTSNLGADSAVARSRIGFDTEASPSRDAGRDRALAAVRAALPPELWNRIDEPLYFTPLEREDVAEIARRMLIDLAEVARARHGIQLDFEPSAIDALISAGGFDPALGARPMRRTIGRLVEAPLALGVLSHELESGAHVTLRGLSGRIQLVTGKRLARAAR